MSDDNTLTLALFDIESLWAPPEPVNWRDYDAFGFAVGVVKWVSYQRQPSGEVHRWTLAENVHFSAAALIDDLLRPWADAIVAYNGLAFDIPVTVHAAVPEIPGPYLRTSDPAEVATVARVMRLIQQDGYPVAAFQGEIEPDEPLGWWDRKRSEWMRRFVMGQRGTAQDKALIGSWMNAQGEHSQVYPAGVTGLTGSRASRIAELEARCFDPLEQLAQTTGHPHVARLDWLREGLSLDPFLLNGEEVDHVAVPQMFRDGRPWDAVAVCRHDVLVIEELLHQAFGGKNPRIFLNRMNSKIDESKSVDLSRFRSTVVGGKWRFHVPTDGWWEECNRVKRCERWRLQHMDAAREQNWRQR